MKKITSLVLAGAVMLSLSACSKSSDASESSSTASSEQTTTEATTTTTTEETTTEETTTESSEESEEDLSFDELIPSAGEIYIDFSDKYSIEITENLLKVLRIRTGTPAEEYANRFSVKPDYSYEDGVWTFDWGENKPDINTFVTLEITAGNDNDKIILDEDSSVSFMVYIKDKRRGHNVYDQLSDQMGKDLESDEFLKDGLAINPRHCFLEMTCFERYDGWDFVRIEIFVKCRVDTASYEEAE